MKGRAALERALRLAQGVGCRGEGDGCVHPAEGLRDGAPGIGGRQGQLGAQRARLLELRLAHIDRDHPDAEVAGVLQCQMADAAQSEDCQALVGPETGAAHCTERGPAGAAEGSGCHGGQIGRYPCQLGGRHVDQPSHRAVPGVAVRELSGAEPLFAGGAQLAAATGGGEEGDADPVADRQAGDAVADRAHAADAFVAHDERRQRQLLEPRDHEVGVANPARLDRHLGLSGRRRPGIVLAHLDGAARRRQIDRLRHLEVP